MPWPEYVRGFAETFPEIPRNMYGKWENMIDGHTGTSAQRVTEGEGERKTEEDNIQVEDEPSKTSNTQRVTRNPKETVKPTNQNPQDGDRDELSGMGSEKETEDETTDDEEEEKE